MRTALLAGTLCAIVAAHSLAAETGFAPIDVRTAPITAFLPGSTEAHFGDLEFRGGFEMSSGNGDFGSLSGLDIAADGQTLVAIADTGFWFTAELIEENGRLAGLADAKIAPVLGENGKPPEGKNGNDSEGLRLMTRDGVETALVSYEQGTAVRVFAGPDFAAATPKRVKLPKFVKGIRINQGLEAIALAPADGALGGSIVIIAERSLDGNGNHRGFILSGPRAGAFAIKRTGEFDVTDAAFLPDGDLIVLERRFSFSGGFASRLRRIAGGDLKAGATVDGRVLLDADSRYQIDNLEGLALRTKNGETILTLVSDNNGNMLQRTILLQFALVPGAPAPVPVAIPAVPPPPHLRPTP